MEMTKKQIETLKRNNRESNQVTREAIRDALYILMRKKDYSDIRITDIINKSGVSRSAFYRNYKSKEDIIKELVSEFVEMLAAESDTSLAANWEAGFDYFSENREKLDLIIKAHLEYLLLNEVNQNLDYSKGEDFTQAMNNGLVFNVFIYWAKCGMRENSVEATHHIVNSYREIYEYLGNFY